MKNLLLISLMLILYTSLSFAQSGVSISTDNTPADPRAMLEVKSTTKGMLVPRMNSTQRGLIGTQTPGLLVYDLTTESFWFSDGLNWMELVAGHVSSLRDTDGDTKIQVEESPDEDKIRFDLNGEERMVLQRNGNNIVRLDIRDINNNTFIGENAGASTNTGNGNIGIGTNALVGNSSGINNTSVGYGALQSNTDGFSNTGIGVKALNSNTVGNYNIAIGNGTLWHNQTNRRSTAIGYQSMHFADNGALNIETFNTAVGYEALRGSSLPAMNIGRKNTAIGDQVLFNNTSGSNNTATGVSGLFTNTTGKANTANGVAALYSNTSGNQNTAMGDYSLYSNNIGGSNTAVGDSALYSNTIGSENTAIGDKANVSTYFLTNATAIGARAFVSTNNSLVLGSISGVNGATNNVNIGIGTTSPFFKLDVRSDEGFATAYFENTSDLGNGIESTCINNLGSGTGVAGWGGYIGTSGTANVTGNGSRIGLYGVAANGNDNFGVYGDANGGNTANGIYGSASNGGTNWAGYFASGNVHVQNNLCIGTTNPNGSAALEVASTTKGFLPPRMTAAQRDAIVGPAAGLFIWCTNCGPFGAAQIHNGYFWSTLPNPIIGQSYGGGIIAYVLQPGDPGYNANVPHGLIATSQQFFLPWYNGTYTNTGALGTALGTGQANTTAIVTNQGAGSYAAQLCNDLVSNGYSDWYLPSKDELFLLYQNGFVTNYTWSSSEVNAENVWIWESGTLQPFDKAAQMALRAVRSF